MRTQRVWRCPPIRGFSSWLCFFNASWMSSEMYGPPDRDGAEGFAAARGGVGRPSKRWCDEGIPSPALVSGRAGKSSGRAAVRFRAVHVVSKRRPADYSTRHTLFAFRRTRPAEPVPLRGRDSPPPFAINVHSLRVTTIATHWTWLT